MKNTTNFFIFILCCLSLNKANCQVGFKLSEVIPNGDIGQFFNKGIAPDLYFFDYWHEGKIRIRMGFLYTQLTSRKDTAPIYAALINGGAPPIYVPGYLVNHNLKMYYMHGDISYRLLHLHDISLFAGIGIVGGIAHDDYEKGYETIITETGKDDNKIAGFDFIANIEYKISEHFDILAEAALMKIGSTSISDNTSYLHSTISIGGNWIYLERPKKEPRSF